MNYKYCFALAAAFMLGPTIAVSAQDAVKKAAEDAAEAIASAPIEDAAPVKPTYWTNSVSLSLGLNNTKLDNWAAGGFNTANLSTAIDAKANYAKELMSWNNRLQLNYGFLYSSDKEGVLQKSNDQIYLESKWAYKTASESNLGYTASFDFRSQFTDTPDPKKYTQDDNGKWIAGETVSGFFSPAYTNIALGIQWVPNKWFDVNIAPLTGGFTIVTNPSLRARYGMKALTYAEDGTTPLEYKSALFQFGAQVKANAKFSLNDIFTIETQATVFTDYLSEPYFRINWDNAINWRLSKLINLSFKTWMINDPNVMVEKTRVENGEEVKFNEKRGWQFKEFMSFSFTYTIANKK